MSNFDDQTGPRRGEPDNLAALSQEQLVQQILDLRRQLDEVCERVELAKITDSLTGLANRDYFFASLARLCARAKRFGQTVCMMLIDIDNFHVINDQYGNLAGDLVLTGLADLLRAVLRDYDLLARFGEDEFSIAIDNGDSEIARQLSQRIRKTVDQNPFSISDRTVPVSITIGIATARSDVAADKPESLVRLAIEAIEIARRKGRNQCHWMEMPTAGSSPSAATAP